MPAILIRKKVSQEKTNLKSYKTWVGSNEMDVRQVVKLAEPHEDRASLCCKM